MIRNIFLALAGSGAVCSLPLYAQTTDLEEAAIVFGSREEIADISLSPSGNKLAYVSPVGNSTEAIYVVNLVASAEPVPITKYEEKTGQITSCDWATEERLVCTVFVTAKSGGMLLGFTRVLAVGDDGKEAKMLTERTSFRALGLKQDGGDVLSLDLDGDTNKILMTSQWVKESTIGTRLANDREGLGVDKIDVVTGRRTKVENPDADAIGYVADGSGEVRLKIRQPDTSSGYAADRLLFYFRLQGSNRWELLSRVNTDSQTYDGLYPVAIDSTQNIAYAFAQKDGHEALYTIPLEENGEPSLMMAREDADIDRLIRIGRDRRVVGASYATEKREIAYLDPELKALSQQLHQALPGQPLVNIIGASADESKLMIVAASDTDPGMTYLYDKATHQLEPLLPLRRFMDGREMGKMTPVSFPAGDGTMIPGYLTLPPNSDGKDLPAIVLPHGGPSARDEWGFDWLVQFFTARGYAVLQPNYRGSSGYGSEWFGKNGFQAWETAIGDVNDAGRWLVKEGIANREKLAVVGWSYGGYAALQSQVLDPELYKAVVAIAPVTDLEQLRSESMRYVSGKLVDAFIGSGDHVRTGSPARNAEKFQSPVLLVHGDLDQNVDIAQSRVMKNKLENAGKRVEFLEFENVTHSLGETEVRIAMLKKVDDFLASNLAQ
ncbi:S9 family peptidase [Altererythrobacter sp. HHU K3-1]|uniref:S9 family peptidase n=2 Tax=Qipengyuania atrilutea TaxID=2744473 RepID=A0A850GZA6_9SPHN|nr:S9 family peptidase [Actirhodobacter atriluteus]